MSEKVLKVLSNAQQGLTNEQKAQARLNIGCAGTYHAGTNIAIDSSTNTISVSGLATVATTGRYSDLSGTPTIPEQVNADWNAVSGKAQILNKPTVTEVKELTGSTAYGPVYTNVPTLTLGNQIISTDTSGSNAAFGIVAPVPTSSDVGKSLVAGNGSTHWETVNPGGKLLKHTATFVRVGSERDDPWHVQNTLNNAINHVVIDNHNGDICSVLIEAPTIAADEEYNYSVVFDCTNSSGSCSFDVENAVPRLERRGSLSSSGQYLRITGSDSASDAVTKEQKAITAVTPNSHNIKDGDGNQTSVVYSVGQDSKWLQIGSASYYGVSENTKLAGPLVVTDVGYSDDHWAVEHSVGFWGDPNYMIRVYGNTYEIVRF